MNPQEHIEEVTDKVVKDLEAKYQRGLEEHGGGLWKKPVINFINDEATDITIYLHVLRDQWAQMKVIAEEGVTKSFEGDPKPAVTALTKVLNILTFGNPEGVSERGD